MKMNRIFTAVCTLAAVSAVAAAEPGAMAQADNSAYIMTLKGVQKNTSVGKSAGSFDLGVDLSDVEQAKLFEEYENFGIERKDGLLYYYDKPVRYFIDTGSIVTVNQAGGRTINYGNICTYTNSDGTVDICVVREESANNAGASFGKIKTIEQVSSLESLLGVVSAQSLIKIAEIEYAKGGIAAISDLLPFLPSESISIFAKDLAEKGSYSEVKSIVWFLCEDTVAEIAESGYERIGFSAVRGLVTHLSKESLAELSKKAMNKNDIDALEYMAFYLDNDSVDAILKKLDSKGERVAGVATFASAETLKELADSRYKKSGVSGLSELLPVMPKSMVNTFVNKAANKKDYTAVQKMAPYAGKKTLKKVAKKMQAEGKSIAGLEAYIK